MSDVGASLLDISMEPVLFSGEPPAICPCGSSPGLIRFISYLRLIVEAAVSWEQTGKGIGVFFTIIQADFHLILVLHDYTHLLLPALCLLSSSPYSFI